MMSAKIYLSVGEERLPFANTVKFRNLTVTTEVRSHGFADEYLPYMEVTSPCTYDHLDFEFYFDKPFDGEDALVYRNGYCTNDFVMTERPGEEEKMSRDILMYHDASHDFGLAQTSAERFFVRFYAGSKRAILRVALENKPLSGSYRLEDFLVGETTGNSFFKGYAEHMKEKHHIGLPDKVENGWSSWSYLYGNVTDRAVLDAVDDIAKEFPESDLFQIDDGWQEGLNFGCDWTANQKAFPDMKKMAETIQKKNKRLGLWLGPTLMGNKTKAYREHPEYHIWENGEIHRAFGGKEPPEEGDGSVYPLDLENPAVLEHIKRSFADLTREYDCHYYKIDFLVRSLIRHMQPTDTVTYQKDFATAVYRNAVKEIRKTVGEDAFMMACGAPISEAVGIFDAIRVSPDITWQKAAEGHPGYFAVVKGDIQNIFYRSFYHNRVFINDPDAIVVRGIIGVENDDYTPTLEEARMWATAVALSGGTTLINENVASLPKDRLQLLKHILPSSGLAAEPEDFFEAPCISHVSLFRENRRLAAVFRWEDEKGSEVIRNNKAVFVFDAWTNEYIGSYEGDITLDMEGHSVRALMLVEKPETGEDAWLCAADDFYMGIDGKYGRKNYYYSPKDHKVIGK